MGGSEHDRAISRHMVRLHKDDQPQPNKVIVGRFIRLLLEDRDLVDRDDLDRLATKMTASPGPVPTPETEPDPEEDREITAAYTYLGQFVDHDVTLDPTSQLREAPRRATFAWSRVWRSFAVGVVVVQAPRRHVGDGPVPPGSLTLLGAAARLALTNVGGYDPGWGNRWAAGGGGSIRWGRSGIRTGHEPTSRIWSASSSTSAAIRRMATSRPVPTTPWCGSSWGSSGRARRSTCGAFR